MICGCLTGSYWGVYKAWFPSCSDIGVIWLCFNSTTAPSVWFLFFPQYFFLIPRSYPFESNKVKKKKKEAIFMPAVCWCILAVNCTCANNAFLYSFKYQNGWLWQWHAWAQPFRGRERKERTERWKEVGVNSYGSDIAYHTVKTPRGLKGFSISKQCD